MSQKVTMVARLGHTPGHWLKYQPEVLQNIKAVSMLVNFWSPEAFSFWQAFPFQSSLLLGVPFFLDEEGKVTNLSCCPKFFCF